MTPPIMPIEGVPEELLRALNNRFREMDGQPMAGLTVTVATAKLTATGANGSMTFVNGILTGQVAAT